MLAYVGMAFQGRVARAVSWTVVAHVLNQLMRFGGNLLMTRLLAPEAFGQMAVVTTLIFGLALFSDLGLNQSVVRSARGADPVFLNTVWTAQIARGAFLFCALQGLAIATGAARAQGLFPEGSVYRDPLLPSLIAAMAFGCLVSSFESTNLAAASRGMALGRVVLLEAGCQVAGLLTTVACGLAWRSTWALVAGATANSVLRTVLSHLVMPGLRNSLAWDATAMREIVCFGKWVFLSSFLGFLAGNADRLLLGFIVDAKTLGLTAIAMLLLGVIQEGFSKVVGGVVFPALSEVVRERPQQLAQTYYRFRLVVDVVLLFAAGFCYFGGASVVGLVYDGRYNEAGSIFAVLSLSLVAARYGVAHQAYLALGRADLLSWITTTRLLTVAATVIPAGAAWGVHGAIWALTAAHVPMMLHALYLNARLGLLDTAKELRCMPVLVLGAMAGEGLARFVASIQA